MAQPSEAGHVAFAPALCRSAELSYKSNLWQLLNQYTKSPATVHNMDLATDILRLADKVGFVPGLTVACKFAMQILQTVQECDHEGFGS